MAVGGWIDSAHPSDSIRPAADKLAYGSSSVMDFDEAMRAASRAKLMYRTQLAEIRMM